MIGRKSSPSVLSSRAIVRQGRQFLLDLLDAGQTRPQLGGQRLEQLELCDVHRLGLVAQRVLGHHFVLALAQQQTDSRAVVLVANLSIHR